MKRVRIIFYIFVLSLLNISFIHARSEFEKGVAYLLLNDPASARPFFSSYFNENYNPIVKSGYSYLLRGDKNEAKKEFNRYLNMNFRSTEALVGISIAVSGLKESTSIENLNKAIKLNSGFSAAYACLGIEYQNIENFPLAEKKFRLAMKIQNIPEYRILLGNLYLKTGKAQSALALIEGDASQSPDNFQLNYLAARALFDLNRISEMKRYVNRSMELKGSNTDVQFIYSKYLYKTNKFKQAKTILKSIRNRAGFNRDVTKLFAKALIQLGDRRAKDALFQIFSKYPWDNEINFLIGSYYLKNKNEKGNIQNWINRSILSGIRINYLKNVFGDSYVYPELNRFSFFKVIDLKWIDNSTLLFCAKRFSGEKEKIYLIDTSKKRISATYNFSGKFLSSHISKAGNKILIASKVTSGIDMYALTRNKTYWSFRKINFRAIPIESADIGFNSDESLAYIVDGSINQLSFLSPFSRVNRFGEKSPLYPTFGFRVYKYNFLNRKLALLEDIENIEKAPITSVKRYFMVLNAYNTTDQVRKLIDKGKGFDVSSTDLVKIIFSEKNDAFIIYFADLTDAFQAVIFHGNSGEIVNVDSSMFLDKGRFSEISILNFDSKKKNIIFSTRDKKKELIIFNYKSRLFRKLAENYYSGKIDSENNLMYILSERDKKHYLTETIFTIANINKGWRDEIPARRDISNIIDCSDILRVRVQTNRGETLVMNHDNKFIYVSPSFAEALLHYSPDRKQTAFFTNGTLYFFNIEFTWGKKENSKK